jgi:hypothetical protein
MVSMGSRRTWMAVGWVGAVAATVLNGVVVGYGAVWFQLFGDTADAEDYAVSAGGSAAAAVVLALAVPAILAHRGPRWLVWPTGAAAVVLGLLAVRSAAVSAQTTSGASPMNTAWDGIGGVLWAPWTWALVALGVHGLYRRLADRHDPTAV